MKKKNIMLTGAAALVSLVAISGIAFSTFAQTNSTSAGINSTAMQNFNSNGRYANLTDEQKAAVQVQMETRHQEMEATQTTIKTAMAKGYADWVAAVKKAYGESAQILDEVTADNFAKYFEASGYMEQAKTYSEKARTILDEINVHNGMGNGMGMGMPGGKGMHGFNRLNSQPDTTSETN